MPDTHRHSRLTSPRRWVRARDIEEESEGGQREREKERDGERKRRRWRKVREDVRPFDCTTRDGATSLGVFPVLFGAGIKRDDRRRRERSSSVMEAEWGLMKRGPWAFDNRFNRGSHTPTHTLTHTQTSRCIPVDRRRLAHRNTLPHEHAVLYTLP